ncbi:MAG: thiol reductant ABC exporter subunit CydD [Gammaproteobacteria bacterium RIFCSPHIGHO2_12_FULL_38_11]|nr:MAG: thiol reductant ABC exporter subunit CydD [Gammaproteobacteria bacterium RIFCSPHIGHO2_12_FULL_38_11]
MKNENYQWLIQHSKPARGWLLLSIALGVISGVLMIAQAGILATIIDRVYLHHATRAMLSLNLILFLSIILIRSALTWAREIVSFQSAKMVKDTIRKILFKKLLKLSPIQLSKFKTGALASTIIEQVEALHGFYADFLPQMTICILLPFIILFFVYFQNWVAGLVLTITAPLIPLFMALIGINTAKLNQENFQTLSRMSAHFLDKLQGLTTLVLFNRAKTQLDTISTISDEYRKKTMQILRIAFLSTATLELFATISIAIIAVYLGLGLLGLIRIGFEGVTITLGSALFILLLAPEFFMPLRQLGTFYHARAQAIGAAAEIAKILNDDCVSASDGFVSMNGSESASDRESLINSKINSLQMDTKPINLLFKDICFSYHLSKNIINNFNCNIPFGECIAITGPSGVGKSTLLNLIAKFIVPQSGNIFVNDINLNKINNDNWRDNIALLHQHPRLFYGTILDNIKLSKPAATDTEIKNVVRETGVFDFVRALPNALNTQVGEHGFGLSGGQAQRVALARILLKNAPIILLDEPTAHLDQENTNIILQLLEKWRGNKTVLIATHDIRLIKCANRILELTR